MNEEFKSKLSETEGDTGTLSQPETAENPSLVGNSEDTELSAQDSISEPVMRALASALTTIEEYVPTKWVDNTEPDIDAAHLNHAEQAIMRVTSALNGAIEAIIELNNAFQVENVNNSISNFFTPSDGIVIRMGQYSKFGKVITIKCSINNGGEYFNQGRQTLGVISKNIRPTLSLSLVTQASNEINSYGNRTINSILNGDGEIICDNNYADIKEIFFCVTYISNN